MGEPTSKGPGWWQASDGLWYSPEQHPERAAATPPTEQFPTFQAPPAAPVAPPVDPAGPHSSPAEPAAERPATSNNKKALLGAGVAAMIALIVGGAFLLLTGNDEGNSDAENAAANTPEETEESEETDEPPPVVTGSSSSPDDPLPTGPDSAVTISYPQGDGTVYTVTINGFTEVPKSDFSEEAGSCFVVSGEMTVDVPAGRLLSDEYYAPEAGVLVDGQVFDGGDSYECDVVESNDLGLSESSVISLTDGTSSSFVSIVLVPQQTEPTIEALWIADPFGAQYDYFEPTVIDLAEPVLEQGTPLRDSATLNPTGTENSYEWTRTFGDAAWDVSITGIYRFEDDEMSTVDGQCVAVLGSVTPTYIDEGEISKSFTTPEFGLVIDGRDLTNYFGICLDEGLSDAGYQDLLAAEVTLGTKYNFAELIWIPADAGEVEAILVGDIETEVLFEPTELDSIPPVN